jgi:hypothetical protein
MAEATLLDHQFEIDGAGDLGGLLIGAGQPWVFVSAQGFDSPDMKVSDTERPLDHGSLVLGTDYANGRTIAMTVALSETYASSTYQARMDLLKGIMAPREVDLSLRYAYNAAGSRRIFCRPRRCEFALDADTRWGAFIAHLQFFAGDPRIYSDDQASQAMTLPSVSGGLGWPLGWPVGWGTAVGGTVNITNLGNFPTRPVVVFTGPLTGPSVENTTTGQVLETTFNLTAGSSLVIDFDARTIEENGFASRYSYLTADSSWWDLIPGLNQVRISASSGTGAATIYYRSAWI